jgi:hypothetical protein
MLAQVSSTLTRGNILFIDIFYLICHNIQNENNMTQPILIGLHGKPRSGKDTICNHILANIPLLRHGPSVQVKKAAAAMFNVPEEYFYDDKKKEQIDPYWGISYREMAQKVGNESSRKVFGEDFWMRHVDYFLYHKLPEDKKGIVLADIRYANEVSWVKERGGLVLFVTRENRMYVANESHDAEKGLDLRLADIVIENNGTYEELFSQVSNVLINKGLV